MSFFFCPPFLSSHPQTAQDISFATVQALFQSLTSRRGCPTTSQSDTEAEKPPPQTDRKSVTMNGKWLLTLAGLWLQMIVIVSQVRAGLAAHTRGKKLLN